MKKSYEELMGAFGRSIFFRPERRRVREILSRDAAPKLLVADRAQRLFDISMNGLSFVCESDPSEWPVGREVSLVLSFHGRQAYDGLARVARTELDTKGARIGLALSSGFLDLPELRRQDEEARLVRQLELGPAPLRARVPPAFRAIAGEAVYFAQYYKQALDRHEARYRATGPAGREEVAHLAERALGAMRGPWADLRARASAAALECLGDAAAFSAAKEYVETALTPLLLGAPMIHRSYTKPLGYPGDYQVMLYYYNDALEGDSAFAQVFHKLFVEHPLSNGVRTRCAFVVDLMREEHERVVAEAGNAAVYRVASLGCGPARESALYARGRKDWPGQTVWTLIDQEEETLSIAYHDTQVELARSGARGVARCLNVSFAQLFGDLTSMPLSEPQDFLFSTGLFDYLRESRAQGLLRELYERLAPGGLLAIGNALGPNQHMWEPEFILDWTLLYRTREEMLRLAAALPDAAEVDVLTEPGNAYYFLLARKPAR